MDREGIGLFNWFMKQQGRVKGYRKAIWTGVTTLTLSKAIEEALKENVNGIYNLVNNKTITKHDLLLLFNRHIKKKPIEILADDAVSVDKSLINSRRDFSFDIPDYEIMIKEMKQWIENHKVLYPHYFEMKEAE